MTMSTLICTECKSEFQASWARKKTCSTICTSRRRKKTNLKKYGVGSPLQNSEIMKKAKKTNLQRYGVKSPLQNSEVLKKIKQTNLERYGAENPLQNEEVQKKQRKTNLERYGVESTLQNSDVKDKIKQTNLERYGKENPMQNSDVLSKARKTNLERYGVECSLQNPEVHEKANKTNLERYGVENPMKSGAVREKFKKTNLRKYGVDHPFQNIGIKDKVKETFMEKYGVDNPMNSPEIREKRKIIMLERYGAETPFHSSVVRKKMVNSIKKLSYQRYTTDSKYTDKINLLFSEDGYVTGKVPRIVECCDCQEKFEAVFENGLVPKCPACFPPHTSAPEKEIGEFIHSIYSGEIMENSRSIISPLEIDIYLPELNLGIELNGVYWHSDAGGGKGKYYHRDKTEACEKAGVKLLHIMDVEWETKQDIIKTILTRYVASHTLRKIGARQTTVRKVSRDESTAFLDQYHLQGRDRSTHRYGLYLEGELVSVMTFGKSRFDRKAEWEMIRYCERGDGYVVGGANKLFKAFIRDTSPESVVTYADRRFFTGLVYSKLGFEFVENTNPNYCYFVPGYEEKTIESRQQYQKHKLSKKLETFDPSLTEWENMQLNGYDRIWDCGHTKWIYKI